jgi:hypothetical protein
VLSGALRNGAKGVPEIKQAGGITMVQSREDAEFESMPRSAISYGGIVDVIAPTADLARAIERYVYGLERRHDMHRPEPMRDGRCSGRMAVSLQVSRWPRQRPTARRHVLISPQSGSERKRGTDGEET